MIFGRNKNQKRDSVVGLDLGTTQIKGAIVQRRGDRLELSKFAVRPLSFAAGQPGTEQQFAEELQRLSNELGCQDRRACVTISCSSAIVCHTEFPRMPMDEVKSALKLNSARYLRRDFSDYYLDATEIIESKPEGKSKKSAKMQVLVGGAHKDEVKWYRDAMAAARIRPDTIELAAVSVVNAFQVSNPEVCQKDVVLLVDFGGRSTTINFLRVGQPLFTRIMHFGGQQLSEYLGQMLTMDFRQAEAEKVNMSEPVQALVRTALLPLAREVRSSIDFFERQHESHVTAAFACGGSACNPKVLELLSEQVGLSIAPWNPTQNFETSHLNGDTQRLMSLAPSLAAAVGAAAARL